MAIARGEKPKKPHANGQSKPRAKRLVIKCASEIDIEPVEWLWPGRLAVGKTTLVGGDPGLGKSQLSSFIAATLSTHGRWPCDEGRAPQKNTIILCAEDGAADTIVPRLVAAGADRSKIHIVTAFRMLATTAVGSSTYPRILTPSNMKSTGSGMLVSFQSTQ